MLERLQQAGKPITPRMQQMADALDKMDTGNDGQVSRLPLPGACLQSAGDVDIASGLYPTALSLLACTATICSAGAIQKMRMSHRGAFLLLMQ